MSGAAVTKTRIMTKMIIGRGQVMTRMMTMMIAMMKVKMTTRVAIVTGNAQEGGSVA